MYFTDNSRDWMSEDLPNDELNRMTKVGQHFGSPFCYQGDLPDQEFGWGRKCSEFAGYFQTIWDELDIHQIQ